MKRLQKQSSEANFTVTQFELLNKLAEIYNDIAKEAEQSEQFNMQLVDLNIFTISVSDAANEIYKAIKKEEW